MKTNDILYQLDHIMVDSRDLESLIRPLLALVQSASGLESVYFTAIDFDANEQKVVFSRNLGSLVIAEGLTVPWADTLCKRSLDEGRNFTNDVPERWGDSAAARVLGIQSYVSEPIRNSDSRVYGTLCGASSRRVDIDDQAIVFIRLFAQVIARQLEREELIAQLRRLNVEASQLAVLDPLTGVANRRGLMDELRRMLARVARDGQLLLVAFIDLDNFKAISDTYGHDAGDRFLIHMAQHLQAGLRAGDYLARHGGDEFVVISLTGNDKAEAKEEGFARKLQQLTRGQFDIGATILDYGGASVGVVSTLAAPLEPEALLAAADAAMYACKQERRRA